MTTYLREYYHLSMGEKNMKCAKCGKEIMGTDYISAGVSNQKKDIYIHSLPCDWYENEGNIANDA